MTEFQICQCGQQPGYPHAADCPYPYYGDHTALIQKWHEDRTHLRAALVAPPFRLFAIKTKRGTWHHAVRTRHVWNDPNTDAFSAYAYDVVQIEALDPE